ncbi:hypothetical protein G7Z17_g10713 [Cylindrodendrum hubeiense]|uniref:RRM domain-containing protein n=1 Tax=Cylindrodendrum hubeiense TaxID=595255 RepID=A0A9P5H104_9HYPO|nr:hypothetical protein G7Z17_g10713 [Cylindrodendrum hubeiense]
MSRSVTPEAQDPATPTPATRAPPTGPAVTQTTGITAGHVMGSNFRPGLNPLRPGGIFANGFPGWLAHPYQAVQAPDVFTPEKAPFPPGSSSRFLLMGSQGMKTPVNSASSIYGASTGTLGLYGSPFAKPPRPEEGSAGPAYDSHLDPLKNALDRNRGPPALYSSKVASGILPGTHSNDHLSSVGPSTSQLRIRQNPASPSSIRHSSQPPHGPEEHPTNWNPFHRPSRMAEWFGKGKGNSATATTSHVAQQHSQASTTGSRSGFRPMAAVLESSRATSNSTSQEIVLADGSAFSGNYRGERSIRNASVRDLKPEDNCALWLTNLPPDCTYHELLAPIRNFGRIWCAVINKPDYVKHMTAAAKVVFFSPGPAQALMAMSLTHGVAIRHHMIKVAHNRVKYKEEPVVGDESRVLIITGSSKLVNEKTLTEFFTERFVFDVDEVTTLINAGNRSVIEYKFGSYRCQAHMGKMSLEKDKPEGLERVEYGRDPCEVGETLSSYGVAGERIQGL